MCNHKSDGIESESCREKFGDTIPSESHKKDDDEMPNETTLKALQDAEKGINMSGSFNSVEELMKEMNK